MENLTEQQRAVKDEIQRWLRDEKHVPEGQWGDWQTLRFCRARKFDVPKIKEMIENYLKWAVSVNLPNIGSLDMGKYDLLKTLMCEGYCNVDKGGRPIYVVNAKMLKADDVFKNYTEEELVLYYVQSYERMLNIILPECSKNMGKRVDTCCTIIDLEGVSVMKLLAGKVKKFLKISSGITQDYYPELMHKMYIINAGYFFQAAWAVVKVWLDPVTQKKINIITGSGKKELLQDIEASKLLVEFGGEYKGNIMDNDGPW